MSNKILDKNGHYRFLPKELRDYHYQKELFEEIYRDNDYENIKLPKEFKINVAQMHINTIDIFLYNMALRGYTLQKDDRFKISKYFYSGSKK